MRLRQINLFELPAYPLFFLMIFVPTTYQPIKAVLIVIVIASIAMEVFLTRRIAIHPTVLALTVAMSITGMVFSDRPIQPKSRRTAVNAVLRFLAHSLSHFHCRMCAA